MKLVWVFLTFAFLTAIYFAAGRAFPKPAVDGSSNAPAEWSVDKGYTANNKVVPGMMMASALSSDGKAEISVRCSKGFAAVYVKPETRPEFEAGTESATFVSSLDGSAEATGHAMMAGRNMTLGTMSLVKRLESGRAFRVRYTPFDGDALVAMDFDLRGLPAAVAAMRDVCGSF